MAKMANFVNALILTGVVLVAPNTSQTEGGAQILITHTLKQLIIRARPKFIPAMSIEKQKILERFQILHYPHIDGYFPGCSKLMPSDGLKIGFG